MIPKLSSKLAPLLILVLLFTSCQTSTVISTLEAVVNAAEIAIPVISAAGGLDPATAAAIVKYLQLVNVGIGKASIILASNDTSAKKAADIVKAFSDVVAGCGCLPPGTPQTVVNVVNAVAQAVANFLANFHPTAKGEVSVLENVKIKITLNDKAKLVNIRVRSENNLNLLK